MLNKLTIHNIQSHKHTVLRFTSGINALTGSSDSGKSSVVRAFRWLIENKPSRDSIKSNFAIDDESFSVKASFFDNRTVERKKSSTFNGYIIDDDVKNPYEALHTNVPSEVTKVLGLTDVNMQEQHTPYFLLQNTAGQVAAKFNKVIGLDAMDLCLSKAVKAVNDAKQDAKLHKLDYGNKRLSYKSLHWVPDAVSLTEEADDILEQIQELENTIETLSSINNRVSDIKELIVVVCK